MVSIAVSFLIMIVSVSVSSGFRNEIRDGISDLTGDVQLMPVDMNYISEASPISIKQSFIPDIEAIPEVKDITPAVYRAGIVKKGESIHGVLFKGTSREKSESDTVRLGVSIPIRLSDMLGLKVGDKLLTYFVGEKVKVRTLTLSMSMKELWTAPIILSFLLTSLISRDLTDGLPMRLPCWS